MLKGEWEGARHFVNSQISWPVGAKCPECHRGSLRRGIKKHDVVQVYCEKCGFSTDRKKSASVKETASNV